jgi:hypothetical protein
MRQLKRHPRRRQSDKEWDHPKDGFPSGTSPTIVTRRCSFSGDRPFVHSRQGRPLGPSKPTPGALVHVQQGAPRHPRCIEVSNYRQHRLGSGVERLCPPARQHPGRGVAARTKVSSTGAKRRGCRIPGGLTASLIWTWCIQRAVYSCAMSTQTGCCAGPAPLTGPPRTKKSSDETYSHRHRPATARSSRMIFGPGLRPAWTCSSSARLTKATKPSQRANASDGAWAARVGALKHPAATTGSQDHPRANAEP